MRMRNAIVFGVTWLGTALILAVVGMRWMALSDDARMKPRVDTVRSVVYDTVTVALRARDTMRIVELHVGPLTEQRLARLICKDQTFGTADDHFGSNMMGMIVCPKNGLK